MSTELKISKRKAMMEEWVDKSYHVIKDGLDAYIKKRAIDGYNQLTYRKYVSLPILSEYFNRLEDYDVNPLIDRIRSLLREASYMGTVRWRASALGHDHEKVLYEYRLFKDRLVGKIELTIEISYG